MQDRSVKCLETICQAYGWNVVDSTKLCHDDGALTGSCKGFPDPIVKDRTNILVAALEFLIKSHADGNSILTHCRGLYCLPQFAFHQCSDYLLLALVPQVSAIVAPLGFGQVAAAYILFHSFCFLSNPCSGLQLERSIMMIVS